MIIKIMFTCLSLFVSTLCHAAEIVLPNESLYGDYKIIRHDSKSIENSPFTLEYITDFYCQNLKAAYGEDELKSRETAITKSFESHYKGCKEGRVSFLFLLMKGETLKGLSWVNYYSNVVEIAYPRVVHAEKNLYSLFATEIFKNPNVQHFHIEIPKIKTTEIIMLQNVGATKTDLFKSTIECGIDDCLAFKLHKRLGPLFFKNLK